MFKLTKEVPSFTHTQRTMQINYFLLLFDQNAFYAINFESEGSSWIYV